MARSASACEWCGMGAAPPAPPAASVCCPPCSAWSTCCRAFSPRVRTRAGSVRSIWSPIVHCVTVAHMPGDQSEGQLRDAVLPCSAAESLVQPGMTQHPDHLPHTLGDLRFSGHAGPPNSLWPRHCCLAAPLPAGHTASALHAACSMGRAGVIPSLPRSAARSGLQLPTTVVRVQLPTTVDCNFQLVTAFCNLANRGLSRSLEH